MDWKDPHPAAATVVGVGDRRWWKIGSEGDTGLSKNGSKPAALLPRSWIGNSSSLSSPLKSQRGYHSMAAPLAEAEHEEEEEELMVLLLELWSWRRNRRRTNHIKFINVLLPIKSTRRPPGTLRFSSFAVPSSEACDIDSSDHSRSGNNHSGIKSHDAVVVAASRTLTGSFSGALKSLSRCPRIRMNLVQPCFFLPHRPNATRLTSPLTEDKSSQASNTDSSTTIRRVHLHSAPGGGSIPSSGTSQSLSSKIGAGLLIPDRAFLHFVLDRVEQAADWWIVDGCITKPVLAPHWQDSAYYVR
ncbi:hypothetical protein JOM56_015208 [Amanita muscaria]